MNNIVDNLCKITEMVVVDLVRFHGKSAYTDRNTRIVPLKDLEYREYQDEPWVSVKDLKDIPDVKTAEFRCQGTSFLIYGDYGNHEGDFGDKEFPEELLFPGLILGLESVAYFEDSLCICYRLGDRLMMFVLKKENIDPWKIGNTKRPTNLGYTYNDLYPVVNIKLSGYPNWYDIEFPILIKDLTSVEWIMWALRV